MTWGTATASTPPALPNWHWIDSRISGLLDPPGDPELPRKPTEFSAVWAYNPDLVVPERMRLYPLPARSPELNPTEHVWDQWREKWLINRMFDCQEAVDCQVQKGLAALEQDRPRVASLAGFTWIKNISLQPQ